jgi:hypothetical protein
MYSNYPAVHHQMLYSWKIQYTQFAVSNRGTAGSRKASETEYLNYFRAFSNLPVSILIFLAVVPECQS